MMRRRYWLVGCVALTAALSGCSGSGTKPAEEAAASQQAAEERTSDDDLPESVRHAVAVAREIEDAPGDIDAILERHGLTAEAFEDLMYDISDDPALSKAYNNALNP